MTTRCSRCWSDVRREGRTTTTTTTVCSTRISFNHSLPDLSLNTTDIVHPPLSCGSLCIFPFVAPFLPGCNFLFDVMPRKYSQKAHTRQHSKALRSSPSPSRASPSPSRTSSSIPSLPPSDAPLLCPTCLSLLPVSGCQEAGHGDRAQEKPRWMNGSSGASAAVTAAPVATDGGATDGIKGAKED